LGVTSWYRRYVENYADKSHPLTALLKSGAPWDWGPEQTEAFTKLKQALCTSPILANPDFTKDFVVKCDASSYALGACLTQGTGQDEHVIEYSSRQLIGPELRYSVLEREALSIFWALTKYRYYLEGREFTVITDHKPLCALLNVRSPNCRLAHYALQLQDLPVKIIYQPGRYNNLPDALSRIRINPPVQTPQMDATELEEDDFKTKMEFFPSINPEELKTAQEDDPDIKMIIDALQSGKSTQWQDAGYCIHDPYPFIAIP